MEIITYKPINKGCLKASFAIRTTVEDYAVDIRDCKLFEKEGSQWIQLPSRQYEQDGKTKNFDYLYFAGQSKESFLSRALDMLKSFSGQKSSPHINEDLFVPF